MTHPAGVALIDAVSRIEPTNLISGMFYAGGSAFSVDAEAWSRWLVVQSALSSPEETVRQLRRVAEENCTVAHAVLAVAGIRPAEPIEVMAEVTLVPLEAIPRSVTADDLRRYPTYIPPRDRMSAFRGPHASAAWVHPFTKQPAFGPRDEPPQFGLPHDVMTDMDRVADILTLCGPSPVVPVRSWVQLDLDMPFAAKPTGHSEWHHEMPPLFDHPVVDVTSADVVPVVDAFRALTPAVRQRLRVPIARLNASLRRHSAVDRAIELGIAIEALLIQHKPDAGESVLHHVRQRAPVLLGGTNAERQACVDLVNAIYDLRSQAVHGGLIDREKKVKNVGKLKSGEVLDRGATLCARLIRRVMELGRVPAWKDVFRSIDL